MVNERNICCCGASSWVRIISWFQIVGNSLLLFIVIFGIVAVAGLDPKDEDIQNKRAVMTAMAFVFIVSFCGIFMGILLLKGANQQRTAFLKAWLIYGVTAVIVTIIATILNATGSSHPSTLGTAVFSGLFGIGFNFFSVICVHIHVKEINEGVYIP
ncbi:uncharacterized protein LOC119084902 [Bradysia coprophila]|uniref:uncharacterized protein LOC119084902 n=1 Tax=Bradysia coprophila TaxID=38358 RepID=UPI00187DB4F7|nr:uncharacterized protein LOC119084902 [Bradysia coprophila]